MEKEKLITKDSPLDLKFIYPEMDIHYGTLDNDTHVCMMRTYIRTQVENKWYLTKVVGRYGNETPDISPVEAMISFTEAIADETHRRQIFTDTVIENPDTILDPNQESEQHRLYPDQK